MSTPSFYSITVFLWLCSIPFLTVVLSDDTNITRNAESYESSACTTCSLFSSSRRRAPHLLIEVFRNGDDDSKGRYVELTKADCELGGDAVGKLIGYSLIFFETSISDDIKLKNNYCQHSSKTDTCTVYNGLGQPVFNCSQLHNYDKVYVVPFNRIFIWPSIEIGHVYVLPHVNTSVDKPVELETMSLMPKVFKIRNLISEAEANTFIETALGFTSGDLRLQRSTTTGGTTSKVVTARTSSNTFDTGSNNAIILQKRIYETLGIHTFDTDTFDGFQIVHYNISQAYTHHFDFLDNSKRRETDGSYFPHNYLPDDDYLGMEGTNRAATVFMYLVDVEEGGETAFLASPSYEYLNSANVSFVSKEKALLQTREYLNASNLGHVIKPGSWEEALVSDCKHRFSVKPKKLEAILFYSQAADGSLDPFSIHSGCPVLRGEKWAANLWIWNGKRGQSASFLSKSKQMTVAFVNIDVPNAELYWAENVSFIKYK
jgi:prolyl 4-hydroxylase